MRNYVITTVSEITDSLQNPTVDNYDIYQKYELSPVKEVKFFFHTKEIYYLQYMHF